MHGISRASAWNGRINSSTLLEWLSVDKDSPYKLKVKGYITIENMAQNSS